MYGTREEAERRLHGTIIGFDGVPVTVVEITGRTAIRVGFVRHPFTGNTEYAELDDPRFNRFETLPLGFVNYFDRTTGMNTAFAERLPVRRQKQGLSNENLNVSTLVGGLRLDYSRVTASEAFAEMTAGVYPTMDAALEAMVPGSSVAVSRDFALRQAEGGLVSLFCRREEVGLLFRGDVYVQPGAAVSDGVDH